VKYKNKTVFTEQGIGRNPEGGSSVLEYLKNLQIKDYLQPGRA
jgi:hypothetical protein